MADGEAQETVAPTFAHSPDVDPTHRLREELDEVKRALGDLRQEADRAALRASEQVSLSNSNRKKLLS